MGASHIVTERLAGVMKHSATVENGSDVEAYLAGNSGGCRNGITLDLLDELKPANTTPTTSGKKSYYAGTGMGNTGNLRMPFRRHDKE